MPKPLFYIGYYPGSRPVKRKYIPPAEIDMNILNEFIGAFDFSENANLPDRVNKQLEAEFNNQFRLRYSEGKKTSDTGAQEKQGKVTEEELEGTLEYNVTDESEYRELPGALGVSFDIKKAFEKGFDVAAQSTLDSLASSVFTFKDLSAAAERREYWEPLLRADKEEYKDLSLSSSIYNNAYKRSKIYNDYVTNPTHANVSVQLPEPPRDTKGESGSAVDFSSVNKLRDSLLDFPQFGSSDRKKRIGAIKGNLVTSFDTLIYNNPEVINEVPGLAFRERAPKEPKAPEDLRDPQAKEKFEKDKEKYEKDLADYNSRKAEYVRVSKEEYANKLEEAKRKRQQTGEEDTILVYDRVIGQRINRYKEVDGQIKELNAKRKEGIEGILPISPRNLALEEQIRTLTNEKKKISNEFYSDVVKNQNGLAQDLDRLTSFEDKDGEEQHLGRRIIAWSKIADYRNRVFWFNEQIDNIAEGNIFKNVIWGYYLPKITGDKLKYFTPAHYTSNFVKLALGYGGFKFEKGKLMYDSDHVWKGSPAWMFNKLLGPVNSSVRKVTNQLMRSKAIRLISMGFGGNVIQTVVSKVVQNVFIAMGGTGVGALPAFVAAVGTYVTEKVWDLAKSAITLDFDKAYEKFVGEIMNFVKAFATILISLAVIIGVPMYFGIVGLFGIVAGTTVDPIGTDTSIINVGDAPGGAGLTCDAELKGESQSNYFSKTTGQAIQRVGAGSAGLRISSCFGECREDNYKHAGIDLIGDGFAIEGQQIVSPFNGYAIVEFAGDGGDFGNLVILNGIPTDNLNDAPGDRYYMYFGHMSRIDVRTGEVVGRGDNLGRVGSTGNSTGPHLHYEIRSGAINSDYVVNPCAVFSCPAKAEGGSCTTSLHGE